MQATTELDIKRLDLNLSWYHPYYLKAFDI